MQKLNALKPGDRFQWAGQKYQLSAIPKKPNSKFLSCVKVPQFDKYLKFDSETMVKPIIRVKSN